MWRPWSKRSEFGSDRRGEPRRRWRAVLGLLAACVMLGMVAVVASGWFTRTERLDGGAIVVRSQPGTDERSRVAARTGARLALRWSVRTSGLRPRDPVEIRLANRGRCLWLESLDASAWSGTDLTGDDFVCVYTRRTSWRASMAGQPNRALALIAHETIHHAQRSLGCVDDPGRFRFQWFVEGMAVWGAGRTLVDGGVWTPAQADREALHADGPPPRRPLRDFETSAAGGAYSLGRFAVADLVARRSVRHLWRFCAAVGRGRPWRDAFRSTFGIGVEDFSRRFDQSR